MKTFTARERAAIYLKAAKMESVESYGCVKLLAEKSQLFYWEERKGERAIVFPELVPFDEKISRLKALERQQMRILALLFAREIALNP